MSITLATTWYPRGELARFTRYLPLLEEHYERIVICYVPSDDPTIQQQFISGPFAADPQISFHVNAQRRSGRYLALKTALEGRGDFIHYVDMDRLLHWVETRPGEWLEIIGRIPQADSTIFGRTKAAQHTHPQALLTTEMISNRVVSHFLGLEMGTEMDVSAGSKAFSRAAAGFLVEHGNPDNSIGTDAEWPILLKKAGFSLQYIQVDGLDYESADQYKLQAATSTERREFANHYDSNPIHWTTRVDIADQIVKTALDVSRRPLEADMSANFQDGFDLKTVFDVDDYLYFYRESLTDERTDAEVGALVGLLELDTPMKILDLACGYGRHANRLATLGHTLTGIDLTPGFLDIARKDALERNVDVSYVSGDMREIAYEAEFDRVMLLFTAFGYFSDEVNLHVLDNVCKALKPGGLLIFDTPNRDALLKDFRPSFVVEKDGNLMIDRLSFDSLTGRYYNHRIVIRNGVRKDKPYFIRLYNLSEIKILLTQVGLELYHLYGGLEAKEFTPDARRMVVIARKPLSRTQSMGN